MSGFSRLATAGMIAIAATVSGCHDGLLHAPAPRAVASLTMAVSLEPASEGALGGPPEAFDRADGALVRFRSGNDVRSEQRLPFVASPSGTVLRVDVPLRQLTETMSVELELRSADRPLFRGSGNATFTAGTSSTVDFSLTPVVASVTCAGSTVQFASYGDAQTLTAAALFATGDTIPGVPITWSGANSAIVGVSPTGVVTAVGDGDADVTCASVGVSGKRSVKVFAVVTRVDVAPAVATIPLGGTLSLTPTLRDARGNAITAPRPITWSTSNTAAATVSTTGLVTAVASGAARIDATSGGVVGSASITVAQSPSVTTDSSTRVLATSATLNGTVNPRGSATQAWFQYGTSPTLATFSETPQQSIGSGTTGSSVAASATNLQPVTTYFYRMVASSAGGTSQGGILSFRTGGAAPVLGNLTGFLACSPPNATLCNVVASVSTTAVPNGLSTDVWFEYTTDRTFTTFSSTSKQSAGNGFSPVNISAIISVPSTQTGFYVRAAAQNVLGTVRSAIIQPVFP
jgi:hypothetical protein